MHVNYSNLELERLHDSADFLGFARFSATLHCQKARCASLLQQHSQQSIFYSISIQLHTRDLRDVTTLSLSF